MFSMRLLTAASLVTLLAGCVSLPPGASHFSFNSEQSTPSNKKPKMVPIDASAFEALTQEGIYYFDGERTKRFLLTKGKKGYVPVRHGAHHQESLHWGSGASLQIEKGHIHDPVKVDTMTMEGNRLQFTFEKSPLVLTAELKPYLVEGLPIKSFLKTHTGDFERVAYFVSSDAVFPKGAIVWRSTLTLNRNELFIPGKASFTGSDTLEAFTQRFSGKSPYCLARAQGSNAFPVGLHFKAPIEKKTARVKGRLVEVAQSGHVDVLETVPKSIFCRAVKDQTVTRARWDLGYVNGTRTLSITLPSDLLPEQMGLNERNHQALRPALVEVIQKKRRAVIPALLWQKGVPLTDSQWRFNKVASDALDEALKAAKPRQKAWEAEHQPKKKK